MADSSNKVKHHTDESVSDIIIVSMLVLIAFTSVILVGIF
jgi:hypothetical protein